MISFTIDFSKIAFTADFYCEVSSLPYCCLACCLSFNRSKNDNDNQNDATSLNSDLGFTEEDETQQQEGAKT